MLQRLAQEIGVNVPETVRVNEKNFFEKIGLTIKFPCIVKPTDSPSFVAKFRRKLFKVNNKEELVQALNTAKEAGLEVIVHSGRLCRDRI